MKAAEFDKLFDDGEEDIMEHLDLDNARQPKFTSKKITLELPIWMLELLDKEALRMGETRQSVIKFLLSDKLAAH